VSACRFFVLPAVADHRVVFNGKMAWLRVLLSVLLLSLSGCGSPESSQPSPVSRLKLHTGAYSLWFTGLGLSSDPHVPACANAIFIRGGTNVTIPVDLRYEHGTWIATSSQSSGSQIEYRFQEGSSVVATIPISGTIKGTAVDMGMGAPTVASGVRIFVRGASMDVAQVDGHGSASQQVVSGVASGDIQFVDTLGNVSICTHILLDLTLRVP
jgi:hypothetical protein